MRSAASGLRVGVVSSAAPTARSGQGNVLRLLLAEAGFETCVCFCETAEPAPAALPFEGALVRLTPPPRTLARRLGKKLGKLRAKLTGAPKPSGRLGSAAESLRAHADLIAAGVRADRLDVLVACSGSLTDIPAATLAAERTGARLVLYIFDDYVHQWRVAPERAFAEDWERRAAKRVSAVICPNEFSADVYRARHGLEPALVRNPRAPDVDAALAEAEAGAVDPLEIVYTGSVYDAQIDSIARVIEAMRRLGAGHRLTIYTANAPSAAPAIAAAPEVSWRGFVENADSVSAQRRAGLLLLPLAFEPTVAEVVRTAAPGKLGEYLASGRPILAHAPADSFVVSLFRRHDCAAIAAAPSVEDVARALAEAQSPAATARVANARRLAEEFALPRAAAAFAAALAAPALSRQPEPSPCRA